MANSDPLVSFSPWDGGETWRGAGADQAAVVAAVDGAAAAFPVWSRATDRRARMQRLAEVVAAKRTAIIELLIREAGKVRADAEAEADLLPRKIAVTLDGGLARTPNPFASGVVPPTTASSLWRPRGVAAILGPFNFPLHLLHGLVAPALAVGCTVVAKPSERCPALGELYRACLEAAGLAEQCRLIQGGAATAAALVRQPAVATVAAVGSRRMGLALAALLAERPEVVLALELGGVNPALILDDADLIAAGAAVADGAWRMAGQRCTATRIVHVPEARLGQCLGALVVARGSWLPAADPAGVVGPMISPAVREEFQRAYRELPAGLELLAGSADGNGTTAEPLLLKLTDPAARQHPLYRDEHFGPALIVDPYRDLDECLERIAANPYRLAASVFTASRNRFAACAARMPYGQVNHNRPTAGARPDQPFGGCGLSGNGRPAALAACQIFADETVVWPAE